MSAIRQELCILAALVGKVYHCAAVALFCFDVWNIAKDDDFTINNRFYADAGTTKEAFCILVDGARVEQFLKGIHYAILLASNSSSMRVFSAMR